MLILLDPHVFFPCIQPAAAPEISPINTPVDGLN